MDAYESASRPDLDRYERKAAEGGASRLFVVNVLADDAAERMGVTTRCDGRVVAVPYLIRDESIDTRNMNELMGAIADA